MYYPYLTRSYEGMFEGSSVKIKMRWSYKTRSVNSIHIWLAYYKRVYFTVSKYWNDTSSLNIVLAILFNDVPRDVAFFCNQTSLKKAGFKTMRMPVIRNTGYFSRDVNHRRKSYATYLRDPILDTVSPLRRCLLGCQYVKGCLNFTVKLICGDKGHMHNIFYKFQTLGYNFFYKNTYRLSFSYVQFPI